MSERRMTMVEQLYDLLKWNLPRVCPVCSSDGEHNPGCGIGAALARAKPYVDEIRSGALVPKDVWVEVFDDGSHNAYENLPGQDEELTAVTHVVAMCRVPQPTIVSESESEPG